MPPPSDRPRRILLLIPALGQGGAEMQLAHLARGLALRGDEVTVGCLYGAFIDDAPLTAAGVTVVELGARRRLDKLVALPRLTRMARRADLVHCGLFDASLYGRLAALAARTPATVTEHSSDRSMQVSGRGASRARAIAWHHGVLAPFTAATVACAASQVDLLRGEGVPDRRLALIPNGVPVGEIRRAGSAGGVTRAQLGVPEDAPLVVQVGRLTPEKDQRRTVEAVAAIRAQLGDVHAVFVGAGDDRAGPDRAHALGARWAHFLGGRTDVAAILALADLAVLPSRVDSFPMAALEAMALGVPQVTTDVGDLGRIVGDTGSGVSVAAGDAAAFATAVHGLLADLGERARYAARAADVAWTYDVGPMVERYSELFDAVLAGAPVPAGSRPALA